jgi:hypothetical protein
MHLIINNALLWDQKVLNWRDLEIIKGAGLVLRPTTVQCDICDYSCSQKKGLNKHVASVNDGKKPFQCNICDASFALQHHLNVHIA